MEKLVLIDGNSLINRAFYAMPLLTTKNGEYTNAVYGFMNMFFKMLDTEKPTAIAVAFDLKAPTFRHKMFTEYKGTRKPMPDELRPQIQLLKDLLKLMGISVVEKEGFEADDLIGTIAKKTDIKTVIFTGDRDSFQLVDEQTEVHFTKRGITDVEILDQKSFKEKTGILPSQVVDLKALMGDSSDNIPGVKGVGEKTALTLIQTYGDIDQLYKHTDDLKGKLQEKIVDGKDVAYLSRALATIEINAPIDTDLSKMGFSFPFSSAVKNRFVELEFKSLTRRADVFEQLAEEQPVAANESEPKEVQLIVAAQASLAKEIDASGELALYITGQAVNVYDGQREYAFPIRENLLDTGLDLAPILEQVIPLLSECKNLIVFSKKELKHYLLKQSGYQLASPCDDVSLMKYLGDFAGRAETPEEVFIEYGLDKSKPAYALSYLRDKLKATLIAEDMLSLYQDVELPLADVLFEMEIAGFKVDTQALYKTGEKYQAMLVDLEKEIRQVTNEPTLNVNSPRQLGEVLFEKLKLGKGKKTKFGYSTSAEVLESLDTDHPSIALILRYRQVQKLFSTYIEGFKPLIDKKTGLIHTSFNQTMTATGRLSSKEPNLQNIPVREQEGRELRKFFVARDDDRVLVGADYSQIELRLLASFSNCKALIDAFNNGKDVHAATAAKVFNVPLDMVTPEMRSKAKAVNFGIIYGMSEYGLAKNIKTSAGEARNYIKSYFTEYPEVKRYMDDNVAFAKENGYAVTILKRRRQIRELLSTNYNLRQFGERVAMNMPLQGSAADVIKLAMLGVSRRLKKENLKSELILQIHDELIIDTLVSEKERVEKLLVEEMENAVNLAVKLTVSCGCGKNWFEAK